LGYRFADEALLDRALTHRSWCAENEGESNERLEFLGDSVLGLAVTRFLHEELDDMAEGEMAKIRASVVSATTLAELGAELELGHHIKLGKGELSSGGQQKPSILSDAFEAVLGAMYIDGGFVPPNDLVLRLLTPRMHEAASGPGARDFKTQLQELAVEHLGARPMYQVVGEGPDHDKTFSATVAIGDIDRGAGVGRSKKEAQQAAAAVAISALRESVGPTNSEKDTA